MSNLCYTVSQTNFIKIPGMPIAYWASNNIADAFAVGESITKYIDTFLGIITGDNDKFLRYWHELNIENVALHCANMHDIDLKRQYWIPYNKGGEFRKWYGVQDYVINWQNGPSDKRRGKRDYSVFYLREYVAWSYTVSNSAKSIATRFYPNGFLWDVRGSGVFDKANNLYYIAALISSKVGYSLFRVKSEVLSCQVENILGMPILYIDSKKFVVDEVVKQNIFISRVDWDSFETSWDFKKHPLI